MNWYTSYYDGPYVGPRYDNYDVGYRVERRPDQPDSDTGIWHFVAHVNRDHSWEGSPEPGRWVYRVAVSSITEEGQTFLCHGNQWWEEVGVKVPTEDELALAAAQREILHAEVTRCAKEAFINNISDEALPIITSYIERTVAEQVAHIDDLDELAGFTVTVCAQGNGADDGANAVNLWLLLLLLGLGF